MVYGTGLNASGQLGLGNVNPSTVTNPAKVRNMLLHSLVTILGKFKFYIWIVPVHFFRLSL